MTVGFNVPVQVRRHSPAERGETVHVQIALLALPEAPPPRESVNVPRNAPVPLESVSYEAQAGDFSMLELRFAREVSFEVLQGRDVRSVVVRVKPEAKRARRAERCGARAPAGGRAHRGARDRRRGARSRAASSSAPRCSSRRSSRSPRATDAGGARAPRPRARAQGPARAREGRLRGVPEPLSGRRGRDARAASGSTALITASAQPIPPRREVRSETPPVVPRSRDLRQRLRRLPLRLAEHRRRWATRRSTTRCSPICTRTRACACRARSCAPSSRAATDTSSRRTRAATRPTSAPMFLSFEQPEGGLSGSIGRRTRSTGGVLGRYDGAELAYRGGESWQIGVLGGMPVDSSRWTGLATDRFLGGVNAELGTFFDSLDVDLFAVGQSASGLLDRAALGGEIRYFREGLFAAAYLDYDAYFNSLNVAQLTGNWQATPVDDPHRLLRLPQRAVPDHAQCGAGPGGRAVRRWRTSSRPRRSTRWPRTGRRTPRASTSASRRCCCPACSSRLTSPRATSPAPVPPGASKASRARAGSTRISRS